jgi:hypothetical protein
MRANYLLLSVLLALGFVRSASAQVTGFALWDANRDVLVSGDFRNEDVVPDTIRACAAIQILVSGSLGTRSQPGSLAKRWDGTDAGCESEPNFGFPDDGPNNTWPCETRMTEGRHTITVTHFGQDSCAGTPISSTFVNFVVQGPQGACHPSGVGWECPGIGSRWRVDLPADAIGATDRTITMTSFRGTGGWIYRPATPQLQDTNGVWYQEWSVQQGEEPFIAFASNCLTGVVPEDQERCANGARYLSGYYNGTPLPEPSFAISLVLSALLVIGLAARKVRRTR